MGNGASAPAKSMSRETSRKSAPAQTQPSRKSAPGEEPLAPRKSVAGEKRTSLKAEGSTQAVAPPPPVEVPMLKLLPLNWMTEIDRVMAPGFQAFHAAVGRDVELRQVGLVAARALLLPLLVFTFLPHPLSLLCSSCPLA